MPKLRLFVASVLIVGVLALVLPLAALAQAPPAGPYICTVYVDDVLAGAGLTVEAYVADQTEPWAHGGTGVTDANGQVTIELAKIGDYLTVPATPLSFTVDDIAATEDPGVDVARGLEQVRLDVGAGFDPLDYDTDQDGELSLTETLVALGDYPGTITLVQLIDVLEYYFSQPPD